MLSFPIHTDAPEPLYEQIYDAIRNYIITGVLKAGARLPSTRGLASSLNVSRNTVDTAYYQLQAEGFIDSAPKSGFYVCDILTADYLTSPAPAKTPVIPVSSETETKETSLYDFSPFAIDISRFPDSIWKKLSRKCLEEEADIFLLGDSRGDDSLRRAVCKYIRLSREVNCSPEQIIIGAGVDYLLQMLSLLFRHRSLTRITMENPCYMKAAHIFQSNGLTVSPGLLDEKGLTLDSVSPVTQVVYVTPSHQYPLGIVMPFGRRKELLGWAAGKGEKYIIEDDHDSEFRYKGKPIPSLHSMDTNSHVIYIGTFSKSIAPAIRVGYMVLPLSLLPVYEQVCGHYACTVSRLDQAILSHFIMEGYFEKHVNRMRKIYKAKHDLVLNCLQPLFKETQITLHGENAGLHLVIALPAGSEQTVIEKAAQLQIHLYGLKEHYLPTSNTERMEGILLGYSNLSEEDIKHGIHCLTDACIF